MSLIALVADFRRQSLAEIEELSINSDTLGAAILELTAGTAEVTDDAAKASPTAGTNGPDNAGTPVSNDIVAGAVVLATCNRLEIYIDTADPSLGRLHAAEAIATHTQLPFPHVYARLQMLQGDDAVQRLFAVAAGLESMVVGEQEISGQVRRALLHGQQAGTVSPLLVRLFQTALRTAREVAAHTGLGISGNSVLSVALEAARPLERKSAVVIGSGALARNALTAFRELEVDVLGVFSPSGRGEGLAAEFGIKNLTRAELMQSLASIEVLFTASGNTVAGSGLRIDAMLLQQHRLQQATPLTIIDLALERDTDESVNSLPNVRVISLAEVEVSAPGEARGVIQAARELVAAAVASFEAGEQSRQLDPAVVALRAHVFAILEDEVARIRPGRGADASVKAQAAATEATLRRFARALLHTPTVRARDAARSGNHLAYIDAIQALYGIDVDPSEWHYQI